MNSWVETVIVGLVFLFCVVPGILYAVNLLVIRALARTAERRQHKFYRAIIEATEERDGR